MNYLVFREIITKAPRKTKILEVVSIRGVVVLGQIRWFGRWRQYAFFPSNDTVYSHDCLNVISSRIQELMEARKQVQSNEQ